MKIIKKLLLFTFALTLLAIIAKIFLHIPGTTATLLLGVMTLITLMPIYAIIAFIKKQHRIEATMMCLGIPLLLGMIFKLMSWPGASAMIILGSQFTLLSSIGILVYALVNKTKLTQAILFFTLGVCSTAFCFKILFWPGSKELIIVALIVIAGALFTTLKNKNELITSKVIFGIIISIFAISFTVKESKTYQILHINLSNQELNRPEDYYAYARKLYYEGEKDQAKINLQLAIDELNNPNNVQAEFLKYNRNITLKTYQKALSELNNGKWTTFHYDYEEETTQNGE